MNQIPFKEQVIVPAQINYLPILRKFIMRLGEKYNLSKHEITAFKISIDEACTNIIKHGYSNNQSGSITMKIFINSDQLILELIDQGKSFNPNNVDKPNLAQYIQDGKKGGLGIFIMQKFLDEITYTVGTQGNILRLIKKRLEYSPTEQIVVPVTSFFQRLKQILFPTKVA